MFELFWGRPSKNFVLHHCDNPPCINPRHIYDGTQQDNVRDREKRHRRKPPFGEKNGRAKLTEEDIRQIRALKDQGVTQRKLAAQFGVGQSQMSRIVRGEQWVPLSQT
jgi:DNA invertase Pin-like site-specific DNA recombinase